MTQNISHHTTGNRSGEAIRRLHGKPLSTHRLERTDLTWRSNIRHQPSPCDRQSVLETGLFSPRRTKQRPDLSIFVIGDPQEIKNEKQLNDPATKAEMEPGDK
jgi:hypothetical protein